MNSVERKIQETRLWLNTVKFQQVKQEGTSGIRVYRKQFYRKGCEGSINCVLAGNRVLENVNAEDHQSTALGCTISAGTGTGTIWKPYRSSMCITTQVLNIEVKRRDN